VAVSDASALRRQARVGSIAYRLAFVFYIGGMITFFGSLGQGIVALWHLQLLGAGVYVVGGFAGWWLCAGIALRLGVSVSAFFTRLGAFLDR
jgi:hypothetical protein